MSAAQGEMAAEAMLDVVHSCLHSSSSEWLFLRELRVGTGLRRGSGQRLDAFALNCFIHNGMRRICYEVKTSRSDFLCELKRPLKRRAGLRYSNEFYFVAPAELLSIAEVPIDCGLVEISTVKTDLPELEDEAGLLPSFDQTHSAFCKIVVPAPWRETPAPTWQFTAAMLRNLQRSLLPKVVRSPSQQRLQFVE